jgi:hypothetical protein
VCVFVDLGIQHIMRMRYIDIRGPSGSAVIFRITLLMVHLKKKIIEYKMCVLIFSTTLSETFFIVKRIERDDKNGNYYSCKIAGVLVRLYWCVKVLYIFSKNNQI